MYQSDRGSYRTKESLAAQFYHSCLGKLIIFAALLTLLALLARATCPDEEKMRTELTDDIRQCIEAHDSLNTDHIDDAVANFIYIFTEADSIVDKETLNLFNKYNRLEYNYHTLYSTMTLYNNFRTEGVRCGIGVFGVVIPTLNFNDFLLRVAPLRKDYNRPILQQSIGDDYVGENPDLGGVFHYHDND